MARVALLVALGAACGGEDASPRSGAPPPDGGLLVKEGASEAWTILSVPRAGGRAVLRELRGGGDTVWASSRSLPPVERVHRLGELTLVLRTPEGGLFRFDPESERLSEVARVSSSADGMALGDYLTWVHRGGARVREMGAEGSWSYRPGDSLLWAGPAENGDLLAMVASGDSAALLRYERGGDEPVMRRLVALGTPAVLTASGRLLAAAEVGKGDRAVRLLDTSELSPEGRVELDGPVTALAASPSSHELYVGVDGGDPSLVVVNRFSMEPEGRRELPARVEEIRASPLGGPLLVRTSAGVFLIPWREGAPVPVDVAWRDDLPLTLPGGEVVGPRGERVMRFDPARAGSGTELGPADHWWVLLRWRPPRTLAGERVAGAESPAISASPESGPPAGASGAAPRDTAAPAAGEEAGQGQPAPGETTAPEAGPAPGERAAGGGGPEPGFYAVVVAARSRDGVVRLTGELSRAGYPTAIQRHRDDAGRLWHRGLVGPYPDRDRAERIGRELQRERDLSVWIKELGPGTGERR